MAVGDVKSDARGSGARFNDGKVLLQYVPMRIIAHTYASNDPTSKLALLSALERLADFEEGTERPHLALIDALILSQGARGVELWRELCAAFDYGAKKYAAWNWAKGMAWSVPLSCIKRHAIAVLNGEETDPESGCAHRGHIGCNIVMLLHYLDHFKEGDDRPPASVFGGEGTA